MKENFYIVKRKDFIETRKIFNDVESLKSNLRSYLNYYERLSNNVETKAFRLILENTNIYKVEYDIETLSSKMYSYILYYNTLKESFTVLKKTVENINKRDILIMNLGYVKFLKEDYE